MLNDMHRMGAALDYPVGGMGAIVEALVRAVEQGGHGSKVHLGQPVESIDCDEKDSSKVGGITVRCGLETRQISARNGVICNAPVWSLRSLIKDSRMQQILNNGLPLSYLDEKKSKPSSWTTTQDGSSINLSRRPLISDKSSWLAQCDIAEMTGSFMHLHLVINATGLNLDEMEAHYTFMDRSLAGDGSTVNGVLDGPCAMSNMIAVSNPSVLLDRNNSDNATLLIHAYCAGNEPFELWESIVRNTQRYNAFKEERASALWRAVESVIPNAREENRVLASLTGSPLTHARFLRRPRGSYGSATEDYLPDGRTPIRNLFLASDGVFPGIGIPAVAIAGASAANSLINVWEHCRRLDDLYRDDRLSS